MKKLSTAIFSLFLIFSNAQNFVQVYQNRVNQVSQQKINTHLQEFEALGVKRTGSDANNAAQIWLINKYKSFGYTDSQIQQDPFSFEYNGSVRNSKNIIVTKTGKLYPNKYVIICGHFDTIVGPGVNDNGSGVSIIFEIARILRDVPTDYSIRFINFSGEEQGLYGSEHYVQNVVNTTNPKMDIKLVFNIDQVGGRLGNENSTVYCDKDESYPTSNNAASSQITQELANCVQLYSPLQTAFDPAYASDYVPFQENGEVITGFYEYEPSGVAHTTEDTYANVDTNYIFNIAKAAVGAAQHFSGADKTNLGVLDHNDDDQSFLVDFFPNPAKNMLHIWLKNTNEKNFKFEIRDTSGKLVLTSENETNVNISSLKTGIYLASVLINGQKKSKKIIIN